MKKIFGFVLLLCLLFCLTAAIPASAEGQIGYVTDSADILTEEQERALEAKAAEISERYHCGVYIVTLQDYREYTQGEVGNCAEELYSYFDLGYGSGRDGLLLLLSMNDRDYALTSYGNYGYYWFGDRNKTLLEENFLDDLRYNDWNGGFQDYLNHTEDILATAAANHLTLENEDVSVHSLNYGDTYRYGVTGKLPVPARIAIGVGLPCVLALIVCSIFKAQMKTAKLRTTAEEYVVPGSVNLRIKQDQFLHRTETRTKIESNSGSSRGGGGGGGFHTHSGKF